jgi:hypothetical protein
MERRTFLLGTAAVLSGCSSSNNPQPVQTCPPGTTGPGWPNCVAIQPPPPPPPPAGEWAIGPVIGGINYSPGMPASTTGQAFTFPVGAPNHVGYLTRDPVGPYSLAGKSKIKFVFEIIGDGPYRANASPPDITYVGLYFQRAGDDWSGQGVYEGYRFYTLDSIPLKAGTWTLEVPLQRDRWTSVSANTASEADFAAAMNQASAVGFTFGNAEGKGHGVYSLSPGCRFTVESYVVS